MVTIIPSFQPARTVPLLGTIPKDSRNRSKVNHGVDNQKNQKCSFLLKISLKDIIMPMKKPPSPEEVPVLETKKRFKYIAMDKAGEEFSGTIEALDENDARKKLEKMGLSPSFLQEE